MVVVLASVVDQHARFGQAGELSTFSSSSRTRELNDSSRIVPGASADVLEESVVSEYAARLGAVDAMRMLQARGLACDGQLTVAGLLLFAELSQRFMPEAFVRVVRYRGTERGVGAHQQVTQDVRIEGPIPRQIPEAQRVVAELQPTRRAFVASAGRFGPMALVPEEVWLEGLVNAVIHRSYG